MRQVELRGCGGVVFGDGGAMYYFRLKRVTFCAVLLFALICSGCAGQGIFGNGTGTGLQAKVPENQPVSQEPPGALANKADQILDIRIDDSPEVTLVRMTGNAPLQDSNFRKSGESQFVLELNGIKPGGGLNSLPILSERVNLSYGGMVSPYAIQLVGTLQNPLDRYLLDAAGNELILALYLSKGSPVSKRTSSASRRSASKASGKAASMDSSGPSPPGLQEPSSDLTSSERNKPVSKQHKVQEAATQRSATPGSRMAGEISKRQYSGKPISLDLLDADLKNVLRLLSDITGTNMLIEPDVAGRVTIKVEKVPWDQVLDMILAMNDLGKEQVGNVVRIARLAKLKLEWNQQVDEIRAKQELLEVSKDIGAITTAYLTVNYAQPVEIAAKITEIKSDKGKISVDDRSSLVIYTDYPIRIEGARNLLARLDRATAQVLIEARIVTATQEVATALGTEWHVRFNKIPEGSDLSPGTRNFQINRPTDPFFGFSIASLWGQTLAAIDFKLSALQTSNQLNIVAAPKVLTINNVKAVITQGTQIPYLVRSDYGSSSTQFKDAVVELQVTPHITPDQKVRLEIQAKQDEPTIKNFQVGDSSVPGIDTRKITTELLVDNGQVVVIGGVMRGREEESNTGTPGLKNIPVLGWLFKNETVANRKDELLIFISPQIVETSGLPPRT
jgi:type IV pilus assembly protein PilQ